jgi:hypothetical protein
MQLDDLALIVIQPGEGRADSPRQFGSLGIAAAIGWLAGDVGCLVRTVPRLVRHISRHLVPRNGAVGTFSPRIRGWLHP